MRRCTSSADRSSTRIAPAACLPSSLPILPERKRDWDKWASRHVHHVLPVVLSIVDAAPHDPRLAAMSQGAALPPCRALALCAEEKGISRPTMPGLPLRGRRCRSGAASRRDFAGSAPASPPPRPGCRWSVSVSEDRCSDDQKTSAVVGHCWPAGSCKPVTASRRRGALRAAGAGALLECLSGPAG